MLRRTLTYLLRTITVLLVLIVGAASVLLYTEPGRTWLAETGLEAVASRLDYKLTWSGIHSPEANLWTIDTMTLHQDNAVDLNLSGIRLNWWPGTILAGRIILDEVSIDRLAINQLDTTGGPAAQTPDSLPITVHTYSIRSLIVNSPVVVDTRSYRLGGNLELFSRKMLLMTVRVCNGQTGPDRQPKRLV